MGRAGGVADVAVIGAGSSGLAVLKAAGAFVAAAEAGDFDGLTRLLARDAVLWTDDCGKIAAAFHPVDGAGRIARFLIGIARKSPTDARSVLVRVNGDPCVQTVTSTSPAGLLALELSEGLIVGIRIVVNPDSSATLLQETCSRPPIDD